eukprot:COSAG02_NODE_28320_length_591_cov_6.693089_1_plen_192_part_10
MALVNLAANNAENKKAIASAGGIAAVVAGMGGHAGSAAVQKWGCGALAHLAHNNKQNSKAIASAGGIAAVVVGMGGHAGSAVVQEEGCMALANLARYNAELRKAIASAGGIVAVVAGMGGHAGSAAVQKWGCRALDEVVGIIFSHNHKAFKQAVIGAGGSQLAMVAITTFAGRDENVVKEAKHLLLNLGVSV